MKRKLILSVLLAVLLFVFGNTVIPAEAATAVTGFSLSPDYLVVAVGDNSQSFAATITPTNATDQTISWSSSNEDIATVDNTGKVSGEKVGYAVISAVTADGNIECVRPVRVVEKEVTQIQTLAFNGSVYVNWNQASAANGYVLKVTYADNNTQKTVSYDVTGTSYTLTNLTNGVQYSCSVCSKYEEDNTAIIYGNKSYPINGTFYGKNVEGEDTIPYEDSVNNLKAEVSDGSVSISWDADSEADGYYIEVTDYSGDDYSTITTQKSSLTFTGLTNGDTYTFRVSAYKVDLAKQIKYGTAAKVTASPQKPGVTGLALIASDKMLHATWDAYTDATGYLIVVEYGTNQTKTIDADNNYCDITDLTNGTQYVVKVCAKYNNSASETVFSAYSTTVNAKPVDDKVQNVIAMGSDSQIIITWDAVEGASGYEIVANDNYEDYSNTVTQSKTSYTFANLVNGETYSFKVRVYKTDALDQKVYGAYSDSVETYPLKAAVSNVAVIASNKLLHVTWDECSDIDRYRLTITDANGKATNYETTELYYDISGLSNDAQYSVQVCGLYNNSESVTVCTAYSTAVKAVPVNDAVQNLTVTAANAAISLSWDAVAGANGYYVAVTDYEGKSDLSLITQETSCSFADLVNGEYYSFRVAAYFNDRYDNEVKGAYCNSVSAYPLFTAVSGLEALAFNQKVRVDWNALDNVTGYRISVSYADGRLYKNYDTTKTYCNFTNLSNDTEYSFKVCGLKTNSQGNTVCGDYCTAVAATPYDDVVKNLTATPSSAKVRLTWEAVDDAAGYFIYAMYDDGSLYKTYSTAKTACNFINLTNNNQYSFKVRTYKLDQVGTIVYSNYSYTVAAIPQGASNLAAVANLRALAFNKKIRVNWDAVSGADGYHIYVIYTSDGEPYKTYDTTKTYCNFTKLTNDKEYSFTVCAYEETASGTKLYAPYSTAVTIAPYDDRITDLTATPSANKIALSWSAVEGADGYYIYAMYSDGSLYKTVDITKTTCNFIKLVNGSSYSFKIKEYQIDSVGTKVYGSYCTAVSAVPSLHGVSGLTALEFNKKIRVNWDAISGADGYLINVNYGDGTAYKTYETAKTYCNFTKLTNGTTYNFKVCAYYKNSTGVKSYGQYCEEVSATPYDDTVQNLTATAFDAKVALSWDASDGADGYYIYAMYGDGSLYKTYSTVKTTCNFTKLNNGNAYQFKVRPYKTDNTGTIVYSSYSSVVSATPQSAE